MIADYRPSYNMACARSTFTLVHPVTSYGQSLFLSQLMSKRVRCFRAVRSLHTYFLPLISTTSPERSKGGHATVSRRPQIFAPDADIQGVWSVCAGTVL